MPKSGAGEGPPLEEGTAQLALFEGAKIRQLFHKGEWHFSVVDVIAAVTGSSQPNRYWSDLKKQVHEKEGFDQLFDKIEQLRMPR